VEVAQAAEVAFVELGEGHEGVGGSAGAGEDGPAVVVPVDYELAVAQAADEAGDGEGGDGGGVLDQDPLGWVEGVG
jgi:hypothetical protein